MDVASETTPDPPPPDGTAGRRRVERRTWVAAAVVVAVLVGAGYGGWQVLQKHETDVAAEQALAAAQQYMFTLTNFNSDSASDAVASNMNGLLDGATGEFKDMYGKYRSELLDVQVAKNASARGTVIDSVVKSASKDKVVVVLLVDQAVTNTDFPETQIDRSRVRMTMNKVDGRWLVGYLEAL